MIPLHHSSSRVFENLYLECIKKARLLPSSCHFLPEIKAGREELIRLFPLIAPQLLLKI